MSESIWSKVVRGNYRTSPYWERAVGAEGVATTNAMLIEAAREAIRFDVSNVAEYFLAGHDQEVWTWRKDFPSLAPPFKTFWMEHGPCSGIRSEGAFTPWTDAHGSGVGVLFDALRFADMSERVEEIATMTGRPVEATLLRDASDTLVRETNDGWVLRAVQFARSPGVGVVHLPWITTLWLDGMGVPFHDPSILTQCHPDDHKTIEKAALDSVSAIMPHAFALALLHCKNVAINELPDQRSAIEVRRDERRGVPPAQFKTLVIEPMKRVLKVEGGAERHGLKKAMHICRGHFSQYGEQYGKGKLFGKYEGQFYVPAHVRGSADFGTVVKDYRVKGPKETAA